MAQPVLLHFPSISRFCRSFCTDDDYIPFHSVPYSSLIGVLLVRSCMISLGLALLDLDLRFFQLPFERLCFRASYIDFRFSLLLFSFSSLIFSDHLSFFSSTDYSVVLGLILPLST